MQGELTQKIRRIRTDEAPTLAPLQDDILRRVASALLDASKQPVTLLSPEAREHLLNRAPLTTLLGEVVALRNAVLASIASAPELSATRALALFDQELVGLTQLAERRALDAISNERQHRRDAESQRKRLQAAIDQMPVGVVITEAPTGKLRFGNAAARDLLGGFPPTQDLRDYARWNLRRLDGTPFPPRELPAARALLENRVIDNVEMLATSKGIERVLSVTAAPVRVQNETTDSIIIAFTEVTSAKLAERQSRFVANASSVLTASLDYRATLHAALDLAVPDLADCCAIDVVGSKNERSVVLRHLNPALQAIAEAAVNRYPPNSERRQWIGAGEEGRKSVLVPRVDDAFYRRYAVNEDNFQVLKSLGFTSFLAAPLLARGQVLGAMTFWTHESSSRTLGPNDILLAEDLARRVASAVDNARLYEMAQHSRRSREDILAVVSHDLRNPLGAVMLAAASLSQSAPFDERGKRIRATAEIIHRSSERMQRLIDDLVDLASIQSGRLAIQRTACAPREIVQDAVLGFASMAHERDVSLSLDIADHVVMFADKDRLVQALSNLIGNAIKVTSSGGGVTVRVREEGEDILFVVIDEGPGIRPEDHARIFERYERGTRPNYKGSGLGLTIAKGIVEAHGGEIGVDSALGKGATFWFKIPWLMPPVGS